jgi:DNA modification methylase
MAIHNKSHHNHALMSLNKMRKNNTLKNKTAADFIKPNKPMICINIMDCCDFLKTIPDKSIQLICIDPPYNLELAGWDIYENYIEWAAKWLDEAYRVLADSGNMVIFGGIQFRDVKSGDLIDIIQYVRHHTKFKLINTIVWYYKNGMSAHRYFANRHEEIIWLAKTNNYYFDLDSVRVPYPEKDLQLALKDKRLNPENTLKGKNPTNVWEIGRLNGNSKERVGHPTQKPVEIIDRLVKALSYPGAVVLDFFAGSGTTGRACIAEGRHCLMCDSEKTTVNYFSKHMDLVRQKGQNTDYKSVENVKTFFSTLEQQENEEKVVVSYEG